MTQAELLIRALHQLTKHFKEHAVLKGGIELSLFSSPRNTNDLDFVFEPFKSKKEIVSEVEDCLESLGNDIKVNTELSSKHAKFVVAHGKVEIEIEISVAKEVESIVMNTAAVAKPLGIAPQVIRIMKPEVALAHKLAAWNERRLVRDLYDIYFWFFVQKIQPDAKTLAVRLRKVESRIPALQHRKIMTLQELCSDLQEFCSQLDQSSIDRELSSIAPAERQNLDVLFRAQINVLVSLLLRNLP